MDRETKIIKIKGVDVVIKEYATARESQAIQSAYFKGTKIEVNGEQPRISDFDLSVQTEVEKEMIRNLVVSFGELKNPDEIVEKALDLPVTDYNELIKEIDSLISKKN